jgi:Flp pilus assembly pilin Flp
MRSIIVRKQNFAVMVRSDSAQAAVEFALLALLVALTMLVAVRHASDGLLKDFTQISTVLGLPLP